ncbi:RluA family pseudouridine synthase [[Mycoplasma] testudinis]|uniref:RluA family pseudouridine synthase n=1 Tax=[Mycoplasma] testudinis TaxID=33924 RepID=UPI0004818CED|nr:RluA family pseudouridine synthase [[Mycoplasma] testudinis]
MSKKIVVNACEGIQRIENYLLKKFPDFSRPFIFKLIRLKKVKINGVRTKIGNTVQANDQIEIFHHLNFPSKQERVLQKELPFLKAKGALNIVYEDENITILDKPVNLLCQPSEDEAIQTLQNLFLKYLYSKNELDLSTTFVPSICHRLDQNTTGLVIAAKNGLALQEMHELLKQRIIQKKYECLVYGLVSPNQAILKAYLLKNSDQNLVRISKSTFVGAKEIITGYKVIKLYTKAQMSLLDVDLKTGRTHQIRAHFNFIGYPLVGETKYTQPQYRDLNKQFKYQALHAYKIEFPEIDSEKFPKLAYLSNKTFISNQTPWFKKLKFLIN